MLKVLNEFLNEGEVTEKTLIKYPSISLVIVVVYVLFVKWIGPSIMRNRKPFDLKYAMIIYDFGQSIVNAYLTYTIYVFTVETWDQRCMVKENPFLSLFMKRVHKIGWHIYLVKYADLIDTCMFVLRKKDDQVSFLHVFHHALMCLLMSCGMKYIGSWAMGYYIGLCFTINTTVHVVVYFYYGLAAFGPHMNKYLWWKKYLTLFQMVQFTLILIYMVYGFTSGCEELGTFEIVFTIYIIVIFGLFIDFYQKYQEK